MANNITNRFRVLPYSNLLLRLREKLHSRREQFAIGEIDKRAEHSLVLETLANTTDESQHKSVVIGRSAACSAHESQEKSVVIGRSAGSSAPHSTAA